MNEEMCEKGLIYHQSKMMQRDEGVHPRTLLSLTACPGDDQVPFEIMRKLWKIFSGTLEIGLSFVTRGEIGQWDGEKKIDGKYQVSDEEPSSIFLLFYFWIFFCLCKPAN